MDIDERLKRARIHLGHLEGDIHAFVKGGAYSVFFDDQYGVQGTTILRSQIVREPPVVKWGVLIGEIVHNLRSALDHMVYELSDREEGPAPDPLPLRDDWRNVGFPIWLDHPKPGKDPLQKYLWALPRGSEARTYIEGLQPFARGQDRDPLWVLQEMWNADKHRAPHIVGFLGSVHSIEKVMPDGAIDLFREVVENTVVTLDESVFDRPIEAGAEIGRITTRLTGPIPQQQHLPGDVREIAPRVRRSVPTGTANPFLQTLADLIGEVETIAKRLHLAP